MWRYGRDYDRGFWDRGREPRAFYDRGFRGGGEDRGDRGDRGGWGMTGLNNAFLYGPPPEERRYDPPIHGPRSWGYDRGFGRPRGWTQEGRSYGSRPWRGGYDRGWF